MNAHQHKDFLVSSPLTVAPEWIDIYGHMNASRYFNVFIDEGFTLMEDLGLGRTYTRDFRCGIFAVSAQIQYQSELKLADVLRIRMRVLQVDRIRLLVLSEMLDEERGKVAATFEQLSVHVNLNTRKATPFSNAMRERIEDLANHHATVTLPEGHVRYLQCRSPAAPSARPPVRQVKVVP